MDKEQLKRWVKMLPARDRDLPSISIDGQWMSPNQLLREAEAGTEKGKKVLQTLSTSHFGTDEEMLKERLRQRLANLPQDKPLFVTLNRTYTPREVMQEVESGSRAGQQFIETERRYLKYTDRLKERV